MTAAPVGIISDENHSNKTLLYMIESGYRIGFDINYLSAYSSTSLSPSSLLSFFLLVLVLMIKNQEEIHTYKVSVFVQQYTNQSMSSSEGGGV